MGMNDEIEIRLATAADVDALVHLRMTFLEEVAGANSRVPELLCSLRDYFQSALPSGEFMGYLAVADRQVVASSGMVIHRRPPRPSNLNGREAYIMNMYTLPAWRGRGIATALLAKLVILAGEKQCQRVSLHAMPMGRAIYAKAGFRPVEAEMPLDLTPRVV